MPWKTTCSRPPRKGCHRRYVGCLVSTLFGEITNFLWGNHVILIMFDWTTIILIYLNDVHGKPIYFKYNAGMSCGNIYIYIYITNFCKGTIQEYKCGYDMTI
jgi:hypothetical protein